MIYIAYDGVNATEVNMTNAVSTSLVDKAVISKETAEEGVTKTLVIKVDDAEQDIDGNKWTAKDSD